MNITCKLHGHSIALELTLIRKGTPAKGVYGTNETPIYAQYAKTYYGAKVTCKRCGATLAEMDKELSK